MFNFLNWVLFDESIDIVQRRFDFIVNARKLKNRFIWFFVTAIVLFLLLGLPLILNKHFNFEFFELFYFCMVVFAVIIFVYYLYIQFLAGCYKCKYCCCLFFSDFFGGIVDFFRLFDSTSWSEINYRIHDENPDENISEPVYWGFTVSCPNCHKKMFRSEAKYKLK